MKPFEIIQHKGKSIIILDISNCQPEERIAYYKTAHPLIAQYPQKSLLILTDTTGSLFNADSLAALKNFAIKNTPYVKASAVVGAQGTRDALRQSVERSLGRDFQPFDTRKDALDWLAGIP